MTEKRVFRSDTFVNRSFVAGIPFILMFGGLTHFAFAWLGKTNWAAPFVPVNESVWEHLKMSYWTTFLWFFFIFLFSERDTGFRHPAGCWRGSCPCCSARCSSSLDSTRSKVLSVSNPFSLTGCCSFSASSAVNCLLPGPIDMSNLTAFGSEWQSRSGLFSRLLLCCSLSSLPSCRSFWILRPEAMGFRLLKEGGYSRQLRSDLPKKNNA